jgi:hypothetical protein
MQWKSRLYEFYPERVAIFTVTCFTIGWTHGVLIYVYAEIQQDIQILVLILVLSSQYRTETWTSLMADEVGKPTCTCICIPHPAVPIWQTHKQAMERTHDE